MTHSTPSTEEMKAKFAQKIAEYAKNPDKRLQEALNNHNANMVRSILKLDLNDNKVSFEELMTKIFYITERFPEQTKTIFEDFAFSKLHKELETNENLWNEDYFLTHQSYLTLNFAVERLIHLAHVKQKLMKNTEPSNVNSVSSAVVDRTVHKAESFNRDFTEKANEKFNWIDFIKEHPKICIAVVAIALWAFFLLL